MICVGASGGNLISSATLAPLVAADIQSVFNLVISSTNQFYSARVSTLTQAQLELSVDVRDLGLFVFDSFISIEQRVQIETSLLTLYASNAASMKIC